jgi:hypothetical protein
VGGTGDSVGGETAAGASASARVSGTTSGARGASKTAPIATALRTSPPVTSQGQSGRRPRAARARAGTGAGAGARGILTGSIRGASSGTSIVCGERAAARTVARSTFRRFCATALSNARAQIVLIWRGTPDDR